MEPLPPNAPFESLPQSQFPPPPQSQLLPLSQTLLPPLPQTQIPPLSQPQPRLPPPPPTQATQQPPPHPNTNQHAFPAPPQADIHVIDGLLWIDTTQIPYKLPVIPRRLPARLTLTAPGEPIPLGGYFHATYEQLYNTTGFFERFYSENYVEVKRLVEQRADQLVQTGQIRPFPTVFWPGRQGIGYTARILFTPNLEEHPLWAYRWE